MVAPQNNKKYDRYIKEFNMMCSDKNKVRFINKLYNTNFPLDSKVERLETETHMQDGERRSDFILRICGRDFHIEVESDDDNGEMIFRMFEYGFRSAYMHGKSIIGNRLKLKFPEPVVIYLRSSDNTPSEFLVDVEFSTQTITESYPIKRLADFTADDLFDNHLYALALFYPMKYEALLKQKHTSDDELKFLEEARSLLDRVLASKEKGEINTVEYNLILGGFEDIFQRVVDKANILEEKEVGEFMETVKTEYAFRILNEKAASKAEGKAEGIAEGIIAIAKKMLRRGKPIEEIMEDTELSRVEIEGLRGQFA